jgi:hypothetical protein
VKKRKKEPAVILLILFFASGTVFSQNGREAPGTSPWFFRDIIPGGHRGKVNSIQYDGERLLSAGEDGFLEIWDIGRRRAVLRFQLSSLPLVSMVCRPGMPQIACIETDGLGQYRISAWDYDRLENLFTLRFRDPVQNISYSAGGSYLVISRSGSTGIVLADPETGELLLDPRNIPEEFPSSVSFAAIGRTERTMLVYSPAGTLSYWELTREEEPRLVPSLDNSGLPLNFDVPSSLGSPVLFGNNRFFAGFDSGDLVVLGADTGFVLDRDVSVSRGILTGGGEDLYCLVTEAEVSRGRGNSGGGAAGEPWGRGIYRFRVDNAGRLDRREFRPLPAGMVVTALGVAPPGRNSTLPPVTLGAAAGELLPLTSLSQLSGAKAMETKTQARILEAAAGKETIAFLAGENRLGFIPLDFLALKHNAVLALENSGGYTRITAAPSSLPASPEPERASGADRFLLWQDEFPLPLPLLRFSGDGGRHLVLSGLGEARPAQTGQAGARAARNSARFPLRSVSALGDRALFLDTGGNISVLSLPDGKGLYRETSTGSIDGAFIDQDTIILGRNAPSSGSSAAPFLKIDTRTSETVPFSYSASLGAQVYRGSSGRIYGVTLEQGADGLWTSIIQLDTQEPAKSVKLVEYRGEDARFSIAEADGFIASNLGGDGAGIYAPWGIINMERGPGLPRRIADGDFYFIILDAEGCISWHDPRTGNILALFRLYENEWSLVSAGNNPIRGSVTR